jgi:hypothetical protein
VLTRILLAMTLVPVGAPSVAYGGSRIGPGVAGAAAPQSSSRPRIVVLAPQLEGDVSSAAADTIADALHGGLRRGDVEVVASEVAAATCTDAACRRDAVSKAGADELVAIRVVAARRDYDITIALVDGATGGEIARVDRRCELCGVAELAEHVDGQAAALLARLQAQDAAPATLVVRSTPTGALVRIDDEVVGETPVERRVEIGTHALRLSLRGYVDEQRRFEALAGVRETIAVELVPQPDTDEHRRMRAGGFAALAIGSAATAAGLTLVALHGRPHVGRCKGDNLDADGDCKYLYNTRLPGILVTSIGVAALVAGITLVAVARRNRAKKR